MKVIICLYLWTTVTAVTVPTVEKSYGSSPVTYTRNGRQMINHGLRGNREPLQFYQNPTTQNSVQVPLHVLKQVLSRNIRKKPLGDNPNYSHTNWVPISPTLTVNGNSYQPQQQSNVFTNLPSKSVPVPVLTKINGKYLPTFNKVPSTTLNEPQSKFIRPQGNNNRNEFNSPPRQQILDGAIKPRVVFNPFPTNEYQTASQTFVREPFQLYKNRFGAPQTEETVSPIFTPLNNYDNPEREREAFLRNFNINQFLEQQKTLSPRDHNQYPETKLNAFTNYFKDFKTSKENYDPENDKRDYSPLVKNHRDDNLHEPSAERDKEAEEEESDINRDEDEKAPQVNQDTPQDIPTKPVYPGEGQWAKPGKKHKLYIRKNPYEAIEEAFETPDGHDTFVKGQGFFEEKKGKFQNQLNQFPVNHNLGQFLSQNDNQNADNTDHEQIAESPVEEEDEDEEDEFVPTKLYAQVRLSEDEEHLPAEEGGEGRLREVVRDSKIQTVYTEEGYEDIGYDHEGHEKLAESDEGFNEKERELQKAEEKKVPRKKVTKESTGYNEGDELISDEEIEADKSSLGINEDSDPEGSQYQELSQDHVSNSKNKKKKKNKAKGLGKKKHNKKDFISTKETKTMTTKDNDDGNMEMEITGEVNVVMQPNNSSKSRRFVKKLPTIHKLVGPELEDEYELARVEEITPETTKQLNNSTDIYIEEVFTEADSDKIITTTYQPIDFDSLEIPITTRPTTAIPKSSDSLSKNLNELAEIDEGFSKIKSKVRRKRFTNDFPEINVDTEFISKIKHDQGPPKEDMTLVKYPYYKKFRELGLNENSPLRYAEDMETIPKKEEGKMTFYDQAESRVACPEIVSTVEPIPERVLNAEQNAAEAEQDYEENVDDDTEEEAESKTQEVQEHPKTPRLSGLGDKIDCLKARYFGENPLDSPFFREDTVGPVLPLFVEQQKVDGTNRNGAVLSGGIITARADTTSLQSIKHEQVLSPITNTKGTNQTQERKEPQNKDLVFELSTEINLITTPDYKTDLKPKNIYDQIRLLEYLPDEENNTLSQEAESPTAEKLVSWDANLLDSVRSPKYYSEHGNRRRRIRMKPKYQSINRQKYIPIISHHNTNNHYQSSTTTSTPSTNSFSEVFYKNQIKPNEQMNVFTDILNNIKTSSENEIELDSTEKFTQTTKIIKNADKDSKRQNYHNQIHDHSNFEREYYPHSMTTEDDVEFTEKSIISYNHKQNFQSNPPTGPTKHPKRAEEGSSEKKSYFHIYDRYNPDKKLYRSPTTTQEPEKLTQQSNYEVTESSTPQYDGTTVTNLYRKKPLLVIVPSSNKFVPRIEQTTHRSYGGNIPLKTNIPVVKGMIPPRMHASIKPFKRDNTTLEKQKEEDTADIIVNKFLVIGMKPPPMQKTNSYFDFMNKYPHRLRKPIKYRNKRSANRAYSSVSRRRGQDETTDKPTTTTEAEDDYVPHRPKNYYYDEKLGKIVYLNQNKKQEEEGEEVEEVPAEEYYVEVKEEKQTQKSTTPKQNPIFATATPPPQGQSYIDFVKKLKSASNYHEIPDPVSTEASQQVPTTLKPVSTTPPAFLSLLAKLHSDQNYKTIEDPDDKETKKKTTTAPPVEEIVEDEDEEEIEQGNVQNSRNGDITQLGENFKIFDINEYIPKIKNYLPKTSIDTSKYKTIERPASVTTPDEEHHPSSRNTENPQVPSKDYTGIEGSKEITQKILMPDETEETSTMLASTAATVPSTTVQNDSSKTRAQIIRNRGRRPARTTVTTQPPTSSTEPIQRSTRRRIARPRSRTTTEKYFDEFEDSSTKIVQRRSDTDDIEEGGGNSVSKNFQETGNPNNERGGNSEEIVKTDSTADSPSSKFRNRQVPKDVRIFKKYDPNQKHGGNYRRLNKDNTPNTKEKITENIPKSSRRIEEVEIISEFDKNKKHGGNYRSETEEDSNADGNSDKEPISSSYEDVYPQESELPQENLGERSEPLRLNLWDKSDTNDDYSTVTTTQRPQLPPSRPKRFRGRIRKKINSYGKQVSRLTDVVPKPEVFFTDPNLPLAVNMLVDMNLAPAELEELSKDADNSKESSGVMIVEQNDKRYNKNEDIKVESNSAEGSEQNNRIIRKLNRSNDKPIISSTNKPVIIKDPNKRLYYSAPI